MNGDTLRVLSSEIQFNVPFHSSFLDLCLCLALHMAAEKGGKRWPCAHDPVCKASTLPVCPCPCAFLSLFMRCGAHDQCIRSDCGFPLDPHVMGKWGNIRMHMIGAGNVKAEGYSYDQAARASGAFLRQRTQHKVHTPAQ